MLSLHQISDQYLRSPLEDSFFILAAIYAKCTGRYTEIFSATGSSFLDSIHVKAQIPAEVDRLADLLWHANEILFADDIDYADKAFTFHHLLLQKTLEIKTTRGKAALKNAFYKGSPLFASLVEINNMLVAHFWNRYYTYEQKKILHSAHAKLKLHKSDGVESKQGIVPFCDSHEMICQDSFIGSLMMVPTFIDQTAIAERAALSLSLAIAIWRDMHPNEVMSLSKMSHFYIPFIKSISEVIQTNNQGDYNLISLVKLALNAVKLPPDIQDNIFKTLDGFIFQEIDSDQASQEMAKRASHCLTNLNLHCLVVSSDLRSIELNDDNLDLILEHIKCLYQPFLEMLSLAELDKLFATLSDSLKQRYPDHCTSSKATTANVISPTFLAVPQTTTNKSLAMINRMIMESCSEYSYSLGDVGKKKFITGILSWKELIHERTLLKASVNPGMLQPPPRPTLSTPSRFSARLSVASALGGLSVSTASLPHLTDDETDCSDDSDDHLQQPAQELAPSHVSLRTSTIDIGNVTNQRLSQTQASIWSKTGNKECETSTARARQEPPAIVICASLADDSTPMPRPIGQIK